MTHPQRHPSPRPAPRRRVPRGEAGTVLALVMLAFMVIIVVAVQLTFSASVEGEHSLLAVVQTRMGRLADAARLQAESALLLDLEDADAGGGGAGGGGGAAGALDGGGVLGGGGGDASEEDVSAITGKTDSKLDAWADPAALAPPMGDGLQVFVEVVSEDGKLNLLGMFSEDEEKASEAREILKRLLDVAFEGTTHDIDWVEASDILDRMQDWTEGRRGTVDPVPVPKLKQSIAEDDAETHQLDTRLYGEDHGQWPLSLDELLLMGPLQPFHLDGFVENDEFFPGLREYLTLDSELEMKPEAKKESVFSGSPFASNSTTSGAAADETVSDEAIVAEATHGGLVNINVAPLPVLRAIAGDDIPRSALELIVDFRDKVDEFDLDDPYGASSSSLFGSQSGFNGFGSIGDSAGSSSGQAPDEEQKATDYVFSDPTEVFGKVEQEFSVEVAADSLQREAFEQWFWVESQVFTIKILVRDPDLDLQRNYRTTVWRMKASDRPRIVTLRPLEPYADPRRLEDYPGGLSDDRLSEMADDRLFATR